MGAGLLIEKLLQRKVHLYLTIKVRKGSAGESIGEEADEESEVL